MRAVALALAVLPAIAEEFHTLSFYAPSKPEKCLYPGTGSCDRKGEFHGQYSQDRFVTHVIFQDAKENPRFFIDLAANHPVLKSNTRALERDYGWRGLCIDGNEEFLMQLVKVRRCTVVGAIVSSKSDEEVVYRRWTGSRSTAAGGTSGTWQHGLSGIVGFDNKKQPPPKFKNAGTLSTKDVSGTTVNFGALLAAHEAPAVIGFMSLDVEGAEDAVLGDGFPFDRYTFLSLTIERPPPSLQARLRAHGYHYLCQMVEDWVYVHDTIPGGVETVIERTRRAELHGKYTLKNSNIPSAFLANVTSGVAMSSPCGEPCLHKDWMQG